jgi:TctA family transporter
LAKGKDYAEKMLTGFVHLSLGHAAGILVGVVGGIVAGILPGFSTTMEFLLIPITLGMPAVGWL